MKGPQVSSKGPSLSGNGEKKGAGKETRSITPERRTNKLQGKTGRIEIVMLFTPVFQKAVNRTDFGECAAVSCFFEKVKIFYLKNICLGKTFLESTVVST